MSYIWILKRELNEKIGRRKDRFSVKNINNSKEIFQSVELPSVLFKFVKKAIF